MTKTMSLDENKVVSGEESKTQAGTYPVVRVIDGDTLILSNSQKKNVTIRFIGCNTPETVKKGSPVEPYGPEASAFTKKAIKDAGDKVRISFDGTKIDQYGRLLAMVYIKGAKGEVWLNELLVQEGLAREYLNFSFSQANKDKLHQAQLKAIKDRKNLWSSVDANQAASPDELVAGSYPVNNVVDADTLNISNVFKKQFRVQLIGVRLDKELSTKAAAFTKDVVSNGGNKVRIEFDGIKTDTYERYLSFAEESLKSDFSQANKDKLHQAQLKAQKEKKNMWESVVASDATNPDELVEGTHSVINVVDGDTLTVTNSFKKQFKLQLIGIKIKDTQTEKATALVKDLLAKGGNKVRVAFDGNKLDDFGRWLSMVYITVGGSEIFLNKAEIDEGFAQAAVTGKLATFSQKAKDELKKAEDAAKKNKKGMWA